MRQRKCPAPQQVGQAGELFVVAGLGCWVGNGGVKGFGRFAGKEVFSLHTVAQPVFSDAASREGIGTPHSRILDTLSEPRRVCAEARGLPVRIL